MIFSSYVNTQSFIVFGGLLEFYSLCFSIISYCMFYYFGTDRRPLGVFNQSIMSKIKNDVKIWNDGHAHFSLLVVQTEHMPDLHRVEAGRDVYNGQ